jgi:hypothetical protein
VGRRPSAPLGADALELPPAPSFTPLAAEVVARTPSPPPAEEPQPPDEEEPGISPEDWKPAPPPNPDPSARPTIDEVVPGKGPQSGGQRVQIRGRNLQPVLVLFGRNPAPILTVGESEGSVTLTVIVPPRTGQEHEWVGVINRDGSLAAGRFEYDGEGRP